MCTVSFIRVNDQFFITSNRDEKLMRKTALAPAVYTHNNSTLLYPKDESAGGSWICLNKNGNAAVLLNGAFSKHVSSPPYRLSRGIIFLDIIAYSEPVAAFASINLHYIEPFTIIIFAAGLLYECRWDGVQKHNKLLNNTLSYIWSSATLYTSESMFKRQQWFTGWLHNNPLPTPEDILKFHQFAGDGDPQNDLKMTRNDELITLSVTGIALCREKGIMKYIDLKNNTTDVAHFSFALQQGVLQ
jgi:Transport and Golgi organisation 2